MARDPYDPITARLIFGVDPITGMRKGDTTKYVESRDPLTGQTTLRPANEQPSWEDILAPHARTPMTALSTQEQRVAQQVESFEAAQQAQNDAAEAERRELQAKVEVQRSSMQAWKPGQTSDAWQAPNSARDAIAESARVELKRRGEE